jgi:2-polyprenyl-6-methoxyphenol hydroxylase-like FAD-dependent oxidoreductase
VTSFTDRSCPITQRIIVVGSGLAGLTVAIAAAQAGHEVEILESAPQITYIGAGRAFRLKKKKREISRKIIDTLDR